MLPLSALKGAALALAALGSAAPAGDNAPNCCDGLEAPFEGAVCHHFTPTPNAGCAPIWVNNSVIRRDASPPVTLNDRRLSFFRTETGQLICDDGKNRHKCLNRKRDADSADCHLLASFWENRERAGYWIIEMRDLAGADWLRLVQVNTCTFAVGNKNPSMTNEIRLGNLDLAAAVNDGVYSCGPLNPNIESQGRIGCKSYELGVWTTNTARYSCCGGTA